MGASSSYDGGHQPTLDEVSANLWAGADWTRRRDLPDIDEWADFIAAPELVHQRLINRLQEGRCPSVAHTFPLPKIGRDEVRKMAWLNPYDDLLLRIIVGRVALAVEAALGADVFSYRLADGPPAWSVRHERVSHRLLRRRARELYSAARCNAIAVADVKNYYPSIEQSILTDALLEANSPPGAVQLIGEMLRDLKHMGAPGGLPIGPEASGVLGNIVLLGLDKAISCHVQGHLRYTDDSRMFLQAESQWPEIYETYVSSVSGLGLGVNPSKVAVYPKGSEDAENAIQHLRIAYFTAPGAMDGTPERSAEEIREELDRDEPDWNVIGFHLCSRWSRKSTLGLDLLYEYPQVVNELPRLAGRYLWGLADSPKTRKQIDADWLVEQATARPTARSLAGQLHLCRVASQLRLGKAHGKRILELATDSSLRHNAPLQAWAAKAWGSSRAHSPGLAVDYACHFGDFSIRRAFALTVSPNASTRSKRSCWHRKLRSVEPDLEPTLARLD